MKAFLCRAAAILATLASTAAGAINPDNPASAFPISDALLVREMARQAIRVAADRGGLALADVKLAAHSTPANASDLDATVDWPRDGAMTITLARGKASPLATVTLPLRLAAADIIPYDLIATAIVDHLDAEFADAVTKAGGRPPRPLGDAPVPADVEAMLSRPNPFSAFRAILAVHAAAARDGESPARLAALARAYANWGEGTRTLLNVQSQVGFARALLYAERLVRARPDDAASYWTRAYVRALVPLTSAADDVAKARSFGSDAAAPPWAALVASLADGDTGALFGAIDGPNAALAAHFAMDTVEFAGLDSTVIHFAEVALDKDPADFRATLVILDNGGVSRLHAATVDGPLRFNRAFDAVASWPELPTTLRPAFAAARASSYDAGSRLALWAALDAENSEVAMLPWGALADVARDASVVLAQRRIDFVAKKWGVDASGDLDAWWPLVRDHPTAPLFESYAGRVDRDRIRAIDVGDFHQSFVPFMFQMVSLDVKTPAEGLEWVNRLNARLDQTVRELQQKASMYRSDPSDPVFGRATRRLYAAAPDDTLALANMIRLDWPTVRGREAELMARAPAEPQIGRALGEQALDDRDPDRAIALLTGVLPLAPTAGVYYLIADAYRQKGDLDRIVKTLQAFVATGEDVGLQFSQAQSTIAQELMRVGDAKRALPFAEAAAESYAGWALDAYAENLAQLGRFEEARDVYAKMGERYGARDVYQISFTGALYPALADANALAKLGDISADWAQSGSALKRQCAPIALLLVGRTDEAATVWAADKEAERGHFAEVVHLATLQLIRGDDTAARAALERLRAIDVRDPTARSHRYAGEQATKLLDGAAAAMPGDQGSALRWSATEAGRTANAALIGAACERAGQRDAAVAWYRIAVRCGGTDAGRILAAMRLKALGDDPLK